MGRMPESYHLRPCPSGRITCSIMSDDRDNKEDPAEELKQGLTHLWKAARGVASGVKKEVERTDFGKELSGAGREFVRAADLLGPLGASARTPEIREAARRVMARNCVL